MDAIALTKEVILGKLDSDHDRIYYSSNEDLKSLLSEVELQDKKVLSVLGSGDQVFSLHLKDVKSIDTFDINPLSKYYYFLRKWSILYCDNLYPNVFSNEEIYKILQLVKPRSLNEMEAYTYWKKYIKHFYPFFTKNLFFVSSNPKRNEIEDLKKLKEKLLSEKFQFHSMDLSVDKIPSKYDSIIISNILEYYSTKPKAMQTIVSNLYDMLSDNGKVVVSYLMNLGSTYLEDNSFFSYFTPWDLFDQKGNNIGRVYKKRDVNKK